MFKGLLALFTTGLIFRPMLLLGGLIGIIAYIKLNGDQLKILYTDWHLYALFVLISSLYAYFFQRTYWQNTYQTDWKETSKTMFSEFCLLTFSSFVGMLLASFFDFSMPEPSKQNTSYSEQAEILELQKQAEEAQKNYNALLDAINQKP